MKEYEEQYVTFETAKLLDKAGFNYKCRQFYLHDGGRWPYTHQTVLPQNEPACHAPTQAQAMRWLREEYHIAVTPIPYRYPGKWKNILVYLGPPMEGDDKYDICQLGTSYDSYEDAAEGGIKHVVKNIVMKVIRERKKMAKEVNQ